METPEIPKAGAKVWGWYWELSSARGHSESGALPLGFRDIKDWMELTGNSPTPGEVDMIRMMDREHLEFISRKQKANR